jgi:hypothetical protein
MIWIGKDGHIYTIFQHPPNLSKRHYLAMITVLALVMIAVVAIVIQDIGMVLNP